MCTPSSFAIPQDLVARGTFHHSNVLFSSNTLLYCRGGETTHSHGLNLSVSHSISSDPRWLRSRAGQTYYILFTIPINKKCVVTFEVLHIFLVIMPYYIFTIQKMQVWAIESWPMWICRIGSNSLVSYVPLSVGFTTVFTSNLALQCNMQLVLLSKQLYSLLQWHFSSSAQPPLVCTTACCGSVDLMTRSCWSHLWMSYAGQGASNKYDSCLLPH